MSLFARLLASFALVAVCSVAATAWLTARNTSGAIERERGETLADDTRINDALLGYAATHPRWEGVRPVLADLARSTGRRIAVTTEAGRPIADSAAGDLPLPARASSVVDPLAVDVTLAKDAGKDRIDPRAVGPFALPRAERDHLRGLAEKAVSCLETQGMTAKITTERGGRPRLTSRTARWPMPTSSPDAADPGRPSPAPTAEPPAAPGDPGGCEPPELDAATGTERKALAALSGLVNDCLERRRQQPVRLRFNRAHTTGVLPDDRESAGECLADGRRKQLRGHVAPPALLFIDTAPAAQGVDPMTITGAALLVLVPAIGVSAVVATRLSRPVRALTAATRLMHEGDGSARVSARASGEIGRLASAFNEMADHLERMEQQRKDMVSDVSHELRTPLSNLRGWLEAVQDGLARPDPELMASLVEEILVLQQLVDDLQELALADAGRLRLHPEPLSAGDLVGQVARIYGGQAGVAGIRLVTHVAGDVRMHADPVRLRQAVGNLISNAIRHTPSGGRIALSASSAGPQSEVIIQVEDTGAGIDPGDLPHIFDRFWRADKSRNRRTGGSGLGLAVVKHLVEAHGGTVTVSSTPGAGAIFTVRLPRNGDAVVRSGDERLGRDHG